ncbi:(2Fe-2S)-binding protein [Rhizobium lentis]|uniref:(2Fe-2S)-binding protein n=1 Tax=Rhizobium lentis TaxID=1138194 RepID=A0ABS7I918_9HYPH|nr:(2Fe-2S)-binding protein [Rhizobium lentis]MBX5088333.1 (2Fe-2S)-binding protein [Rhizobium lentis]
MISVKINGDKLSVDPANDMPLLWYLRDHLNLTGTKYGCGVAACGACTVHVDGQARRSCITPLSSLDGSEVTTIEGLAAASSEAGELHPIQAAWIEAQAPQCGYCQSGQIMQAAALLGESPDPTDEEISASMAGNLCRCMAYIRIRAAIKLAAKAQQEAAR